MKPKAKKGAKKTVNTQKDEPKKNGRPTIFSQEIADRICNEIATSSKGLRSICSQEGMPAVCTVMKWLDEGHKSEVEG